MFIVKANATGLMTRLAFSGSFRSIATSAKKYGAEDASSSSAAVPPAPPVRKVVYISQSHDVFSNLALEDWLYKKGDFRSSTRALLLWRNSPCVVVGRHQNPWTEADVEFCSEHRIPVARRNSGGGAVYHDIGNLNCTFFMPRSEYDRKSNLEVIRSAVWESYGLELEMNERDDLEWRGRKVSGTAAKLGRDVAYHHCTLLVHSDRAFLHRALGVDAEKAGFQSKATASVKAKTACLREAEPLARVSDILAAIGRAFLQTSVSDKRGNRVDVENGGYQMVNPTEYWYPGLSELRRELSGWGWIYGKTPEFSVTRRFTVPSSLMSASSSSSPSSVPTPEITVTLRVSGGLVVDAEVSDLVNDPMRPIDISRIVALKGQRYAEHLLKQTVADAFDSPVEPSRVISPTSSSSSSSTTPVSSTSSSDVSPPDNRTRLHYEPMDAQEREFVTSILTCA